MRKKRLPGATMVWVSGVLICAVLQSPAESEIRSAYTYTFDEEELLRHDNVILLSQTAAHSLHRAPRATEYVLCRTPDPKEDHTCLGVPTIVYARVGGGVKAFPAGSTVSGESLERPWLLLSYAGDERAPVDAPVLFVLDKRPVSISFADAHELKVTYAAPDTGWIARMPLYGYFKLQQKGKVDWREENRLPPRGLKSWLWRKEFPREVEERVEWWTRVCRAFPVGFHESFSVDREHDTITTREDFRWLLVRDDWDTKPLRFAAIPPMVAFSQLFPGLPVTFSADGVPAQVKAPWYVTVYGPYMGVENADRVEYTVPFGRYINTMVELDRGRLTSEIETRALKNIEAAMQAKFVSPSCWRFDWGAGNLVWALHSDQWYARAIPLVSDAVAQRAKKSWRLYMQHFAIEPWMMGWRPMRGRWMLLGPGIGAWGAFGDAGKLGGTSLASVFAFAHFSDGWDLIKEKWEFIRGMANTDLVSAGWLDYCRTAHAEWGDIGPPDIALARMAYRLGDTETGDYFSFLAARQLIAHFGTFYAGKYFRDNGPHRSNAPMPATVFASHIHRGSGWFVNGPGFQSREAGGGQWVNRFVRFACPDLGRFYRDTLDERMRRYLGNPDVLKALSERYSHETHILPSSLRLWGLATTAQQVEVASKGPWESWKRGSSSIGGSYAVLFANKDAWRLTRVVDRAPASPFVPGQEREPYHHQTGWLGLTGGWHGSVPFSSPWLFSHTFGRDDEGKPLNRGQIHFGTISPPDLTEGQTYHTGQEVLHWAGIARWADIVPARELDAESVERLKEQFHSKWMVCGPFSIGIDDGIERGFPPETAVNFQTKYPSGRADETAAWKEAKAVGGQLDSQTLFGGNGRIGYHLQYIRAPTQRQAKLRVRHNGGCKAWLNDSQILYTHVRHRANVWSAVNVVLQKGWNKLLVKTEGMWGRWVTAGHVYATDGAPFDDLEYSPTPPK